MTTLNINDLQPHEIKTELAGLTSPEWHERFQLSDDGVLTHKQDRGSRKAGQIAGTRHKFGWLLRVNGVFVPRKQATYFMRHGKLPATRRHSLAHWNGDIYDDHLDNVVLMTMKDAQRRDTGADDRSQAVTESAKGLADSADWGLTLFGNCSSRPPRL